MQNTLLIAAAILISGCLIAFAPKNETTVGAVGGNPTVLGTATTSAAVAVTSSTRVLATTTNTLGNGSSYSRKYATICNPSSTVVYVRMDGDKAASLSVGSVPIAAAAGYDACIEITDKNLYHGSVQASSTNQTSVTLYVQDYVE